MAAGLCHPVGRGKYDKLLRKIGREKDNFSSNITKIRTFLKKIGNVLHFLKYNSYLCKVVAKTITL